MATQAKFARLVAILAALSVGAGAGVASAQEGEHTAQAPAAQPGQATGQGQQGEQDLAKATQNPVANLISVPLQYNLDLGIGEFNRARHTLNIQPVIPVSLTKQWNLINRIILPVLYLPTVTEADGGTFGLGDTSATFFISPAHPGSLIWGVGPALLLPTATSETLGTQKWSAGPSAVLLVQPDPWTFGVLFNNVWSFAGSSDRSRVNQFLLQYFITLDLPKGWYVNSAPIITANWTLASGERWIVPFGLGAGKIFKVGGQALNGSVSGFYNAIRPDTQPAPDWQVRFQLAFLFPEHKGSPAPAK